MKAIEFNRLWTALEKGKHRRATAEARERVAEAVKCLGIPPHSRAARKLRSDLVPIVAADIVRCVPVKPARKGGAK